MKIWMYSIPPAPYKRKVECVCQWLARTWFRKSLFGRDSCLYFTSLRFFLAQDCFRHSLKCAFFLSYQSSWLCGSQGSDAAVRRQGALRLFLWMQSATVDCALFHSDEKPWHLVAGCRGGAGTHQQFDSMPFPAFGRQTHLGVRYQSRQKLLDLISGIGWL